MSNSQVYLVILRIQMCFGQSFRFAIRELEDTQSVFWNVGKTLDKDLISDYKNKIWPYDIEYEVPGGSLFGREIAFSVTIDINDVIETDGIRAYRQSFYFNGEKICDGRFDARLWSNFAGSVSELNYFNVGMATYGSGFKNFAKMNAYAIRIYNRSLSESEVIENYNKAVAYHDSLK